CRNCRGFDGALADASSESIRCRPREEATPMQPDPLSRDAVLEVLRDLVRIPSVNPTLAPEEGAGEEAVARFAVEWLGARGVKAWLEEADRGRPNAVAEVGGGDGRTLVLCAHVDTV